MRGNGFGDFFFSRKQRQRWLWFLLLRFYILERLVWVFLCTQLFCSSTIFLYFVWIGIRLSPLAYSTRSKESVSYHRSRESFLFSHPAVSPTSPGACLIKVGRDVLPKVSSQKKPRRQHVPPRCYLAAFTSRGASALGGVPRPAHVVGGYARSGGCGASRKNPEASFLALLDLGPSKMHDTVPDRNCTIESAYISPSPYSVCLVHLIRYM